MLSYHSDSTVKEKYVNRMRAHIAADELVRGIGFENGKGCMVGCTLNKYDHKAFETELGIPEWMAHLVDELHEGISDDYSPGGVPFALAFLKAVPEGIDLSSTENPIHIFIQKLNLERVRELDISDELKQRVLGAIQSAIDVHQKALRFGWDESVARSVARSAESAVRAAAWAAWSARAAAYDNIADELLRLLCTEESAGKEII